MKLGILGGGQLAKMLANAAHPLGIEIICAEKTLDCSAKSHAKIISQDFSDIDLHFKHLDCVTYETENLHLDFVAPISNRYLLLPNLEALKITQDRLLEKNFLNELKIPTVRYESVETLDDLKKAVEKFNFPLILKTRKSGYDGKGQKIIRDWNDAKTGWEILSSYPLIAEAFISYDFEVSLISVRNKKGDILFYPLALNHHQDGILRISEAPFENPTLQTLAENYARLVLEKLNYVGVMTIEFFSKDSTLIANEIAPRVHNSGHWTIEGSDTSQFENHLRAILDLPLGSTRIKEFSTMINLLHKKPDVKRLLAIPGLHYHWYGKEERANRKLGHVTLGHPDREILTSFVKKAMEVII